MSAAEQRRQARGRIERSVRRLCDAEIANALKGGTDPAAVPGIEAELIAARAEFAAVLRWIMDGWTV